LSLGTGGVPEACTDARTIGRLAYAMLSGHPDEDATALPLSDARPELSPAIVRETEALMVCDRDASARDARALITLLGGKPEPGFAMAAKARPSNPPMVPAGPLDDAIVVVREGFGFNARLLTAVAVAAIIAVMGLLLFNRSPASEKLLASSSQAADTMSAAGEVALAPSRPDTPMTKPAPVTAVVPAPSQSPSAKSAPATIPAGPPTAAPRMLPPESRREEPPRGIAPTKLPSVMPPVPRDSTAGMDVCDSTDEDAQHACLLNAMERNDKGLDATYQRLIAVMRRQGGAQEGDFDPESVTQLRAAQRRWVEARDTACRDAGDGPRYARARAQCFADQTAKRARELEARLAAIP
jgi:uncharacterized protein YecT (DUF1311 family)